MIMSRFLKMTVIVLTVMTGAAGLVQADIEKSPVRSASPVTTKTPHDTWGIIP